MELIFVDTDVVLDLLEERAPFYKSAAQLFSRADQRQVTLLISSLSFTTIHNILRKKYASPESRKLLARFKVLVKVVSVDDKVIELALASGIHDFEDAIQYYAAIENHATTIITRNLKDYKKSSIPVMTAEGYLKSN